MMTNQDLAKAIRNKFFADRDNVQEAFDYAMRVFQSLGKDGNVAATTALMVVMNTLANELEKVESK